MSPDNLTFDSQGVECAAWHYRATHEGLTTDAGRPALVMAHGLAGTKDSGLAPFAEAFADAGLDVVLFDYRGFGASEGTPRQTVSLAGQVDDYRAALAAAAKLPDVDASRLVLWGVSLAGGHVLSAAAGRHDIAAVVALIPMVDGIAAGVHATRSHKTRELVRATGLGIASKVSTARGRGGRMIPVVARPGEVGTFTLPGALEDYLAIAGPTWVNEIAADVTLELGTRAPAKAAATLTCPVLVQIADFDQSAPPHAAARAAFAAQAEVRHYPGDHFDVFPGKPFHEPAVKHAVSFLVRHLAPIRERDSLMAETVQQFVRTLADSESTGLAFGSDSWTWAETVGDAAARARVLRSWADPDRPLHVGVLMENTPEMIRALLAGAIGAHVTAGINATRRGESLAADVRRADCQVLLTDTEHLPLLDGLDLGGARIIDTDSAEWAELVADASRDIDGFAEVGVMDTFMLIFTSGTSGEPKAVQVSNFMVVMSGSVLAEKYALTPDDVCYCAMPLFHSNAIMASFAPALAGGATIALARKFSATQFLKDIRHFGATYMNYVGKPLAYVLATPELPDDADNPLRTAFGNEASDRDIAEFGRRFGCTVWDGFGSTETAVIITRTDDTPLGSIGQPFEGVAVYDRETRTECPPATFDETGAVTNLDECVGELVNTQGAGFFSGYYNDEAATSARLDGGMYWSGDLGYRDDKGFIYLAGRTDDWLRVDGENLAAATIESLLLRNEAISQACVYAVPDPLVGDQLMVTVVLRDDASLDPEGFETFLADQADLSPKGWPRYVRLATEVPTTATNKVLKRELRIQGTDTTDPLWEREERGRSYAVVASS